jgi:hypothetical protein
LARVCLPLLAHLWRIACHAFWHAALGLALFWMGTALLPPTWCRRVRGAARLLLRWLMRSVAQLIR